MKTHEIMMLAARKLRLSGCGYARNKEKEQPSPLAAIVPVVSDPRYRRYLRKVKPVQIEAKKYLTPKEKLTSRFVALL